MNFSSIEKKLMVLMADAVEGKNKTGGMVVCNNPKGDVRKVLLEGIKTMEADSENLEFACIIWISKNKEEGSE